MRTLILSLAATAAFTLASPVMRSNGLTGRGISNCGIAGCD